MQNVMALVHQVAQTDATGMIAGENGHRKRTCCSGSS